VSLDVALARMAEIQAMLQPRVVAPAATATSATATAASPTASAAGFAGVLGQATASGATTAAAPVAATGTGVGAKMVAIAQAEIGQTEQPPGSNDSPRIAEYRTATAGSGVGPWCNYFVSWAAKQAGAPLGEQGQGFGAVAATWDWAQRTGRAVPPTQPPQPGDLIVWDGTHIGMVEGVLPDGRIQTIEGNSSNMVTRRVHGADGDGATGYVRMS
jgi:CHAP domain